MSVSPELINNPKRTVYDVQLDLDLDLALDKAVEPPTCEWEISKESNLCAEPATWLAHVSCGHSFYFDDEHAAMLDLKTRGRDRLVCNFESSPRHAPKTKVTIKFVRITS